MLEILCLKKFRSLSNIQKTYLKYILDTYRYFTDTYRYYRNPLLWKLSLIKIITLKESKILIPFL